MGALPVRKASPLTKEAQKFKSHIDTLITKMQKETKFTPTRAQLEECAEMILDYINQNHSKIAPHTSYLKAAIIDLTEVPQMSPQMQRISFLTSLKDASKNIELFTSCI